jgi:magnesium-transporting ATPase (P-type)
MPGECQDNGGIGVTYRGLYDRSQSSRTARQTTEPMYTDWHTLTPEETFLRLSVQLDGLAKAEVERRLARYGPNALPPPRRRSPWQRLGAQFHNVLIYVLLAAAAVTTLLRHWVDTGVIIGVVIVNAVIGFVQEGKAERALDAIRQMLSPKATVLRDGRRAVVAAEELVPGDLVYLQSGDRVPADLRLTLARNLSLDESALTGESLPVGKSVERVEQETAVADRTCLAHSGTLVASGQGEGVVVATGGATEIGRISALLAEVKPLITPLLRKMAVFGRWLTVAIVALAAATFLFGVLFRAYGAEQMFMASVGLAVAAIPEGLPAIMSITLAIGVQRMASRNAIIRRLPAVETLGALTVICSDKTGTLTRNEMTVRHLITGAGLLEVSGVGYDPHGGFSLHGKDVEPADHPGVLELLRAALLCNDSTFHPGEESFSGDPTEAALLVAALKGGLDAAFERETRPRTDVIPFESEHRFMATLHHDHAGRAFVYLKGAPERVLGLCSHEWAESEARPLDLAHWVRQTESLASRGERVMAFACKPVPFEQNELRFADVDSGLTLLGLCGMMDVPRPEAVTAVRLCQSGGIRVKMITGDHALTARMIGAQLGIGDGRAAMTGQDIEGAGDEELRRLVWDVDIYARVSPEHKLRLVQALQAEGHVVAMTGDGVNDAPALKRADIGVAMGVKGTEVAKEAAEMVLADDNFASIGHAVEEGRTVADNLRKAILFILPTNGGEAFTLVAAILMGRMLPITPLQILWVNMITAVTLALALPFEPPEAGVMQRPPRNPREPLLSPFLVWRIAFVTAILVAGTFGLFLWERQHGASLEAARTVAVNTLVVFEVFYLFSSRHLLAPALTREGLLGNRYALIAVALVMTFQVLFTYTAPMQMLFATEHLSPAAWTRIVLVGLSVLALVEAEKAVLRRWLATPGGARLSRT